MDWKGLVAIFMACSLMAMGVWTNHCSEALSMICSAVVAGVFGLARSSGGSDNRKVHNEINNPPAIPPSP